MHLASLPIRPYAEQGVLEHTRFNNPMNHSEWEAHFASSSVSEY